MKKLFFGFVLIAIVGLTFSCVKEDDVVDPEPGTFAMTFTPYLGDVEAGLNSNYTLANGYPIAVENIRFYLAKIRLIKASGEEVPMSQIEFFDLKNNKSSAMFSVPSGKYDSIAFDLGVPAELNSPDNLNFLVSAYDNSHPLSESNGMFWGWEAGYRFFTIDGHCDTVPNTSEILPNSFSYHSGRDTLYRKVPAFYHPITIQPNQTNVNAFAIDLNTFFQNGYENIDLKNEPQFHGSLSLMPLGIRIADNSAACFKLIE